MAFILGLPYTLRRMNFIFFCTHVFKDGLFYPLLEDE